MPWKMKKKKAKRKKEKKKALSAVPGRKLAQHSAEHLPRKKPTAKPGGEQTLPSSAPKPDTSVSQQHVKMASCSPPACSSHDCPSSHPCSPEHTRTFFSRSHQQSPTPFSPDSSGLISAAASPYN